MAHRDAQDAQHAPSVHGTRSTTRSTTSKPHPARTSRSVTAFRSRSASAGQSRTAAPENAPARTPGGLSQRAPTARSARLTDQTGRRWVSTEWSFCSACRPGGLRVGRWRGAVFASRCRPIWACASQRRRAAVLDRTARLARRQRAGHQAAVHAARPLHLTQRQGLTCGTWPCSRRPASGSKRGR